ncbi:sugar phosphate permease [Oikeobacillus pervagus]|uniref:Sugar phosphate permease n=1 Tax=Oikeobacillus pervagus TaxID=1325931 RepID=A0AAJ1T433_9BACI|nr:sugar phosphate permease [Oikeobacillus pervagus]
MGEALKQRSLEVNTVYGVLFAISAGHLFNDSIQAVVPAMFPILEHSLHLSYAQIGWIAFMVNMTSSVMQPVFGYVADKRPSPFLLPVGMLLSMIGLIGFPLINFLRVCSFMVSCRNFELLSILFNGGLRNFHQRSPNVFIYFYGGGRSWNFFRWATC